MGNDIMEHSIVQSNPLAEARKKMTLTEMRLFCLAAQDIAPHIREDYDHDKEFPLTLIPTSVLTTLFKNNTGSIKHLRRCIEKAFDNHIDIGADNGGFKLRHIYEIMDYESGKGLYVQFNQVMRPYLLDLLGQQFTSIKMKEIWPLQSEYSWRLMEMLMEKRGYLETEGKAFVAISIEQFRFRMNVPENAYQGRMDNFKRKIIDAPIAEINKNTPYRVWYETEKQGRRIAGYCFWIKKKTAKEAEKADEERQEKELNNAMQNETVQALISAGIWPATAVVLYKKHGEERCRVNLGFAKQCRTENTRNFAGFVIDFIEQDRAKGEPMTELTEEEKTKKKEKEEQESAERVRRGFEIEYEGYEVTNPILINKKKEIQDRIKKIADDKKI